MTAAGQFYVVMVLDDVCFDHRSAHRDFSEGDLTINVILESSRNV
jgi:hypothetical protein